MSTSRRRIQALLLALPAAALVWACQDVERPAPSALVAGRHIAYDEAPTPTLTNGVIYLCKSTPPGTSGTFEINMIVPLADGSQDNLQAHISSGECKPVTSTSRSDPTFITWENLDGNPGWTLTSVTLITTAGGTQELVGGAGLSDNRITCTVDSQSGCIMIFHNAPKPPEETPCPAGSFTYSMSANGDLVIKYDQFPAPNDNSYGVNAVGWGSKGHTFGNLVGSDHAGFQLLDGGGTVRLSFNIDYLTAVASAPSGYASLGPNGGDGKMLVGTSDGISATTSLANNLNNINIPGLFVGGVQQFGSVNVLVNSPPTDPAHQTYNNSDPALAGWDFHDTYFVTISAAKLAAIGFDPATWQVLPNADQLHNSPAKVCPTDTGTGGCQLSVLKVEVKDRQVKVTIRNDASTDTFLTDLVLNWPSDVNGKLTKVKHDGDVVYDNPDIAGGTVHLTTADMVSDQNKRKWGHTSSHVLTFEFEKNADANLAHYGGTASFLNCVLSLFGQ